MYPQLGAVQYDKSNGGTVPNGGSKVYPTGRTGIDTTMPVLKYAPMPPTYVPPILIDRPPKPAGDPATPPKAANGVMLFPGGPITMCVPGYTGPDCRTPIAPSQPTIDVFDDTPIAEGLPVDEANGVLSPKRGPGGGTIINGVEVGEGELPAPTQFDFGKLVPLALAALAFLPGK
ncbi:MAG: hypothetical protein GY906_38675 [bacterium]|nr:hypothetical protein [bacterium]